jgi:integrase
LPMVWSLITSTKPWRKWTSQAPMTTFRQFANEVWMPRVVNQLARSTRSSYLYAWEHYLLSHLGELALEDFKTPAGQLLFNDLRRLGLSRVSLRHLKAVVSAILTQAIRCGIISQNPMTYVEIPKGGPTYSIHNAYTLKEICDILDALIGMAKVAVALAAYTGLRRAELQGVQWPDYRDGLLHVSRAVWRGHVGPTKNQASNAPVPVIPKLAQILDQWRQANRPYAETPNGSVLNNDYILAATDGGPVRLDKLADSSIRPALTLAGLPWYGFHAFRRGLATNLHELGVQDRLIQAIMRHSRIETTQNIYIQARHEATAKALTEALERV